jgi:hypothetical protein
VFYTNAFDNDFAVGNERRFDFVLSYNVLKRSSATAPGRLDSRRGAGRLEGLPLRTAR